MVSATDIVTVGVWTHLVATFKLDAPNGTAKLYVNGALRDTNTTENLGDYRNSRNTTIGVTNDLGSDYDGQMAFPRIWNRTLSDQEIVILHNNHTPQCYDAMTGPTLRTDLVAAWEIANWKKRMNF